MNSFYVTGTDTGIGKTVASTALLHALRLRGLHAVGMKPVASGCVETSEGWRNDDALALLAASDPTPAYADLNPYALPQPWAPELAAQDAGVVLELDRITVKGRTSAAPVFTAVRDLPEEAKATHIRFIEDKYAGRLTADDAAFDIF